MAVVLADVLDEAQVVLELRAETWEGALREIAATMEGAAKLREPEKFIAQVASRERATTTYVGNGVAFPHARTDHVSEILLGIGRSAAGVSFSGGDAAKLIFLIAVPQRLINDYLVCVGALARLTREETTRDALLNAANAKDFVQILREGSLLLE
ncbi:MAG: PTS sugar transporter subunit IIA [Verrucomicrobiota bacterium]|nr:PTS sugar transporter subunit IIA [Verrucomicrobiota bacterium]